MSRGALCLLGPADGKLIVGPERVKLATSASIPATLIGDEPATDQQDVKVVIYLKHTFEVEGREFDFYIPEDASRADAFAALYDGYCNQKEPR
jgi:hypothetical protein